MSIVAPVGPVGPQSDRSPAFYYIAQRVALLTPLHVSLPTCKLSQEAKPWLCPVLPGRMNTQPYLTIFPAGCRGTASSTHCRTPEEETINILHLAPPRLSRLRWQWEEHLQLSAGTIYSILFKPTPSEKKNVHCDCLWLLSLLVFPPSLSHLMTGS